MALKHRSDGGGGGENNIASIGICSPHIINQRVIWYPSWRHRQYSAAAASAYEEKRSSNGSRKMAKGTASVK